MELEETNAIGNPIRKEKFSVGDRVVAVSNTRWDEDIKNDDPDRDIVLLAGHYGHVVNPCKNEICQNWRDSCVHVAWEGTIDNRRWPTIWASGAPWHMYPEELEHAD